MNCANHLLRRLTFRGLGVCRELHGAEDSFAFLQEDQLIRLHILQRVDMAARPTDLKDINLVRFSQSEVDAQVVLRDVTPSAAHFINLLVRLGFSRRTSCADEAGPAAPSVGLGFNSGRPYPTVFVGWATS